MAQTQLYHVDVCKAPSFVFANMYLLYPGSPLSLVSFLLSQSRQFKSVTCWGLLLYCYIIAGITPISYPHAASWEGSGWKGGHWRKGWGEKLEGCLHAKHSERQLENRGGFKASNAAFDSSWRSCVGKQAALVTGWFQMICKYWMDGWMGRHKCAPADSSHSPLFRSSLDSGCEVCL